MDGRPCERWLPASAARRPENLPAAAAGSASDKPATGDAAPCDDTVPSSPDAPTTVQLELSN